MPENKNHVQLQRSLGLYSALSLVIGTIIGSGIFFKQSSILANAHTTTMAIAAWVIGGIITLTSGLTIAEIGSLFPHIWQILGILSWLGSNNCLWSCLNRISRCIPCYLNWCIFPFS